jgi:hypothetical protein
MIIFLLVVTSFTVRDTLSFLQIEIIIASTALIVRTGLAVAGSASSANTVLRIRAIITAVNTLSAFQEQVTLASTANIVRTGLAVSS